MDADIDEAVNVLGERLKPCAFDPMTGFFRDGCCNTGPEDRGQHTICAVMTAGAGVMTFAPSAPAFVLVHGLIRILRRKH